MNNTYVDSFLEIIDSLKKTPQRRDYHPEGDVFMHTAIVWWQCINDYCPELLYAALFHDMGKVDTLDFHKVYGHPTSYGHESVSARYVDIFGKDIIPDNVNFDLVKYIVYHHMRIKKIIKGDVKKQKADAVKEEGDKIIPKFPGKAFKTLKRFSKHDNMLNFFDNYDFEKVKESILKDFNFWLKGKIDVLRKKYPTVEDKESQNREIFLVRGCPGSGKNTFADSIASSEDIVLSADQYFENENGEYNFNKGQLREAHIWCQNETETSMSMGFPKIYVCNTFTQLWEMLNYMKLSQKYKYRIHTLIMENRHNSENIHNVPFKDLNRMKKRFQIKL